MSDRPPLLSLDQALARLLQGAAQRVIAEAETISTFDGLGRVLAAEVRSAIDVPGADNSSMDGYALRAADAAVGALLPVAQRIPAGVVGQPLAPQTAARIFTGAQVPRGADAVLMQEQAEAVPGAGLGAMRVRAAPLPGEWIRRRGEDVRAGDVVLAAGARLTPQALGLAASVGTAQLQVLRRPRVALLSTGDELVMPGQPLKPGAIYNSNRFMLRALLQACGCECTDFGIVPDRLQATRDALRRAAEGHDLIVTSGGVSVGEEDHLKPAARAEGTLEDWQIAAKPGKPLAFGQIRRPDGTAALLIGLPGNDSLLATHADVASPAQLERFRAFASTLYPPRAHIGAIAHGDFDPQWLKDITRAAQPGWRLTRSQPPAARAEHGWTFAPEVIFAAPKLTALFAGIGRDGPLAPVERAKGVLRTGRDWRLFDAVAGGGLTVSDVSWRRDSRIECIAFEDARPDWTAIGAAWRAARGEAGAEGGQQGGQ